MNVVQQLLGRVSMRRPITSYTKVQAAVGWLLRNRYTRSAKGAEYLNVGCGTNAIEGFTNLDYWWRPGVSVCWDLTRLPLPFENETLQGIYSEHCLEHISVDQCEAVLREFFRMLRRGGRVRLALPDAELYMRIYFDRLAGGSSPFPDMGPRADDWTPIEEVNRVFRNYGHQYAYDVAMIAKLLKRAGFEHIQRCAYRQGEDPKLLIDWETRAPETLYVEAVKAAGV